MSWEDMSLDNKKIVCISGSGMISLLLVGILGYIFLYKNFLAFIRDPTPSQHYSTQMVSLITFLIAASGLVLRSWILQMKCSKLTG